MEKEAKVEEFKRDTKLNIHQRINKVMGEIDYIKKNKSISLKGGTFTVTGHDAVTALVHPLLVKYGINIIPTFEGMYSEMIIVKKYDKEMEQHRVRVDASFRWVNIDDPKDFIRQEWSSYGCDSTDKGPGMAISYIQRYVVLKTLHLETGDKDLEENEPQVIEHSDAVKKLTAQQDIPLPDGTQISDGRTIDGSLVQKIINAFIDRKMGTSQQKVILDAFKVDNIKQILNSDYEKVMAEINSYSGA
jgi:hypothetical protein